ncbi:pyridoxal-phosphate-dependent aminotransferase family protein [Muricoccus radiodurans]|uniref:pyridoxal-phosphate-dependent aminotransferase family protein n=1 Tax=Muricoccus radiodurans TaxID=2231721 RepID=UPI003CFB2550
MVLRGRPFFHNPGPTNIPDRVLHALHQPSVDHRGDVFQACSEECFEGLREAFGTTGTVLVFPATGHGGWEAALVNTCSPGDRVLVLEAGSFARSWAGLAGGLGLEAEVLGSEWRDGIDPASLEARLRADPDHAIRAVMIVHGETSTGMTADVAAVRTAMDAARHPAMLFVDVISSLASLPVRMDAWRADVCVGASQKGLMLPTGGCVMAVGRRALEAARMASIPRGYWNLTALVTEGRQTGYPGTSPVHLFFGLREALRMLREEGWEAVFARHRRLAAATRAAVRAWSGAGGLELYPHDERLASNSVTAILVPGGQADAARVIARRYHTTLAGGVRSLEGQVLRIGHLGDLNEPMILGALAVAEMAMREAGIPLGEGALDAAMRSLESTPSRREPANVLI